MPRAAPIRRAVVRLPREKRVQDILVAAREVFCEHGYDAAAMSEIAARAGVVEGTINKYFESKRDLIFKVMAAWYESMVANFATEPARITGTRARLRHLVWRHLRSIRENPALCRVFFREARADGNYHRSFLHQMNRRYTSFLAAVIEEAAANGEIRADAPIMLMLDAAEHNIADLQQATEIPVAPGPISISTPATDAAHGELRQRIKTAQR